MHFWPPSLPLVWGSLLLLTPRTAAQETCTPVVECTTSGAPANAEENIGHFGGVGRTSCQDEECEFKCREGFVAKSGEGKTLKYACGASGDWGPYCERAPCEELVCDIAPSPPPCNAAPTENAKAERGDEGDKITATCEAGYELGGTARWTCTQGAWSGGSRCTAVQCSGPPEEHTQSCDSDSFPTGSCTAQCEAGYVRASGNAVYKCGSDKKWVLKDATAERYTCTLAPTPPPPHCSGPPCLNCEDLEGDAGESLSANCTEAFRSKSSDPSKAVYHCVTANNGAEWQGGSLKCEPVVCDGRIPVDHTDPHCAGTKVDAECIANCSAGYIKDEGASTFRCNADGSWSPTNLGLPMECVGVPCEGKPENNTLSCSGSFAEVGGDTCTARCIAGYTDHDSARVYDCGQDGQWHAAGGAAEARCTREVTGCKTASPIANASGCPNEGNPSPAPEGKNACQVYCLDGYEANKDGNHNYDCDATGQWVRHSGSGPILDPLQCTPSAKPPPPPTPPPPPSPGPEPVPPAPSPSPSPSPPPAGPIEDPKILYGGAAALIVVALILGYVFGTRCNHRRNLTENPLRTTLLGGRDQKPSLKLQQERVQEQWMEGAIAQPGGGSPLPLSMQPPRIMEPRARATVVDTLQGGLHTVGQSAAQLVDTILGPAAEGRARSPPRPSISGSPQEPATGIMAAVNRSLSPGRTTHTGSGPPTMFCNDHLAELQPQDWRREGAVAEGAYGTVYKATWRGVDVALKEVRLPAMTNSKAGRQAKHRLQQVTSEFVDEIKVSCKMTHPNLVRLLGYATRPRLLIVQELLSASIEKLLYYEEWEPTHHQALKVAHDVACGMAYLHTAFEEPIIHRDLKSPNLLLVNLPPEKDSRRNTGTDSVIVKIADFGLSKDKEMEKQPSVTTKNNHHPGHAMTAMMTRCGSTLWMAPEILMPGDNRQPYNEKVDVFSYAMCLVEILDWRLPWHGCGGTDQVPMKVTLGERPKHQLNKARKAPSLMRLADLVERCWEQEPGQRPAFIEIEQELRQQVEEVLAEEARTSTREEEMFIASFHEEQEGPLPREGVVGARKSQRQPPARPGRSKRSGASIGGRE